jgi:hypothetical protein
VLSSGAFEEADEQVYRREHSREVIVESARYAFADFYPALPCFAARVTVCL